MFSHLCQGRKSAPEHPNPQVRRRNKEYRESEALRFLRHRVGNKRVVAENETKERETERSMAVRDRELLHSGWGEDRRCQLERARAARDRAREGRWARRSPFVMPGELEGGQELRGKWVRIGKLEGVVRSDHVGKGCSDVGMPHGKRWEAFVHHPGAMKRRRAVMAPG